MFKPPCLLGLQVAPTPCSPTGQPDLLHHAYPGWLPAPGCGIATCLNRAIGMTGLPPAGLQPCRLLLTPVTPEAHLSVLVVIVRIDAPVFPTVGKGRQLHRVFRGYIWVRSRCGPQVCSALLQSLCQET